MKPSMHIKDNGGDISILGANVPNLYLVLLKFRFPPINVVQRAPNEFTCVLPHADSLLLFADVVKRYKNSDWRYDLVSVALSHKFDREYPESLHQDNGKYNVSLSSVLIPVRRRRNNKLELYLPMRYSHVLLVTISKASAILGGLYRIESLLRQESLWIRKRDDIAKLAIIATDFLNKKSAVSEISVGSGGYRAIDLSVKVPIEFLSTEYVFFASVRDREKLVEELDMLKKSGVGKKRDMGFGDLISYDIYKVQFSNKIAIESPMILLYKEKDNYFKIITLRNLPVTIVNTLRQKNELIIASMNFVSSRIRPPYWIREEIYVMPFSEFLLRRFSRS